MTGVLWGMSVAIVLLLVILAVVIDRYINIRDDETINHAACIAHVADVTSDRVIAIALREYARRWDAVEEKINLVNLSRTHYKPGGPGMPAIWLNQQADLLDPPVREDEE